MTMTPRARVAKMVEKAYYTFGYNDNIPNRIVVALLLREHRRVVRVIQQRIAEVDRGSPCQENVSYRLALTDLLAALRGER